MGCHALLQGNFPTQGSNLGLPYCRLILYSLSHQGSPRILEWVTYPSSRDADSGIEPGSPASQVDQLSYQGGKPLIAVVAFIKAIMLLVKNKNKTTTTTKKPTMTKANNGNIQSRKMKSLSPPLIPFPWSNHCDSFSLPISMCAPTYKEMGDSCTQIPSTCLGSLPYWSIYNYVFMYAKKQYNCIYLPFY